VSTDVLSLHSGHGHRFEPPGTPAGDRAPAVLQRGHPHRPGGPPRHGGQCDQGDLLPALPAKEDLVEAYLRATDADLRAAVAEALDQANPEQSAAALLELIGQVTCSAGFRGCHFINASAEYRDPGDPVRVAVTGAPRLGSRTP